MRRQVAQLAALALHRQVRHAPALLAEILHQQFGQFLPAQRVVQQHRRHHPVALAFEDVGGRRIEEQPRLRVTQLPRLAFAGLGLRALDALDRVVRDRVGLAQVVI